MEAMNTTAKAYMFGRDVASDKSHDGRDDPLLGSSTLPTFSTEALTWTFILGVYDECGFVSSPLYTHDPVCGFRWSAQQTMHEQVLDDIQKFSGIPSSWVDTEEGKSLTFSGPNCIDFLGNLYKMASVGEDKLDSKYDIYKSWLSYIPTHFPGCHVFKASPRAVTPTKSKESDAGYDLTVIEHVKQLTGNTSLYDTGIKISVPFGMYAEVVPRSSLSKSGYMLANSVGIIDVSYTGNIYIALTKIDTNAPDITFPFRCCQLIFRRQVHVDIVEVDQPFSQTSRGGGGFGSTGTK